MTEVCWALLPSDGVFFKDGRGWTSNSAGRGRALAWPFPSSLRGAARTAWGRACEAERGKTFSPNEWLTETKGVQLRACLPLRSPDEQKWQAAWPVPLDALFLRDPNDQKQSKITFLDPKRPDDKIHTLGSYNKSDSALEKLWLPKVADSKAKPAKRPAWWSQEAWVQWLSGSYDAPTPKDALNSLPIRTQVHLAIDADHATAKDGALYATETVELFQEWTDKAERLDMWAIGLKLALPSAREVRVATLGGKRKLANVLELNDASPFAFPDSLGQGLPSRGLRLVAVTPHHAKRTDHPCLPDFLTENDKGEFVGSLEGVEGELVLRAAYVGRPMHVSGWDMVTNGGEAKPTRRLAPPGSVWFFQKTNGSEFTREEFKNLWMKQLTSDEDGLNCVVPGVWNLTET